MKWSEIREPCEDCRYHHVKYESKLFGSLYIEWKGWKDSPSYDCIVYVGDEVIMVNENTLDSCKFEVWKTLNNLVTEEMANLTKGGN